jgi:hypothetical protein
MEKACPQDIFDDTETHLIKEIGVEVNNSSIVTFLWKNQCLLNS